MKKGLEESNVAAGEPLLAIDADSRNIGEVVDTKADQQSIEPVKDNRLKAIIFMNLFSIGAVGNSIFFKVAAT